MTVQLRTSLSEFRLQHLPSLRDAQKLDTRRRLVVAAIELLSEGGIDKATVNEIAQRANVSRSTVYQYFDNKFDIATAIGESIQRDMCDVLTGLRGVQPGSQGDLSNWLDQYQSFYRAYGHYMLHSMAITSASLRRTFDMQATAASKVLEAWAEGGWTATSPTAAYTIRHLYNFAGRWLSYHEIFDVPEDQHDRAALIEMLNGEICRICGCAEKPVDAIPLGKSSLDIRQS